MRAVALFVFTMFFLPSAQAAILDGKTFTGEIGSKGEGVGTQDNFVFQDGRFASTLCSTFGYLSGEYEANIQGDTVLFESKIINKNGGIMDWKGSVKGDTVEGIFVMREEGPARESWFRGILKK